MANNPIDTNSFTHWLRFKSLGMLDLYQIHEPDGFKEENFVREENEERFSSDIFFANEKENLKFSKGTFERIEVYQIIHPDGTRSRFLDMGLNWILETKRRFGYEGEIERVLMVDGVEFVTGILDMSNPDTDGMTYFACDVIQNNKVADYKKQLGTSIDILASKNINGEPITPAPIMKFLRRAVPKTGQSQWSKTAPRGIINFGTNAFMCLNRNIISSDIKNTLVSTSDVSRYYAGGWQEYTFDQWTAGGYDYTPSYEGRSMKLLTAKKLLTATEINVRFKGRLTPYYIQSGEIANFYYAVMVCSELEFINTFNSGNFTKVFNFSFPNRGQYDLDINETVPLTDILGNLKDIPMDKNLYGFFTMSEIPLSSSSVRHKTYVETYESLVTVTASEVSLDNVQSGVRYIDVAKQCSKFINDTPVIAPIFDVGGEHYNNVCYNRALITLATSNSIELFNDITPEGKELYQVVYNTNDSITSILPKGYYFWNGLKWIALNSSSITNINLTSSTTPAGAVDGDLAFNNSNVSPVGLCFWNGTNWNSLQYTRPFITTIQDCFENSMTIEACADYEIQEDKILMLPYEGFFENVEVGAFLIDPSKDFHEPYTEESKCNNIKIGFETYETNRLSKNTANDLHTEAEWVPPNKKVENKFERTIKYIRSGYSAQAMVDLETNTPQTADENDDKVFIEKIIELPDDEKCRFSAKLFIQTTFGVTTVLNRNSSGEADEVVINWNQRGFAIGQQFTIFYGLVQNTYTITAFTASILTLTPVGTTTIFSGDTEVTFEYFYEGVEWQTMHDQGYTITPGTLQNPSRTPNLDYTLRRIWKRWEVYFKQMLLFCTIDHVKNVAYKNNPPLISQKGSGEILIEKADIIIADLPDPRTGALMYEINIFAYFSQILDLLKTLKTTRGFIRGLHIDGRIIKGYISRLEYVWSTGNLRLNLREKYEPQLITLVYSANVLYVNDAPYDLSGILNWYKITNEYFQCFDSKQRAICNIRRFSDVSLNGIIYNSVDELKNGLDQL